MADTAPSASIPVAAAPAAPPPRKRPKAAIVLPVLVALIGIGGAAAWAHGRGRESTDDAFVEAHVANVAPRVQGQVARVHVKDNQEVAEGDVLVELDDRDQKVRLAAAKADLAAAKANVAAAEAQLALVERSVDANTKQAKGGIVQAQALGGTSRAAIDQAKADVTAAKARRTLARTELDRVEKLFKDGAVAQAELDARRATFDQADAALEQANARLVSAQAGIGNAAGTLETAEGRLQAALTAPQQVAATAAQVEVARARVAQAEVAVSQAELALSYCVVKAPLKGVVSRRTVEPGQMADPGRPMLAITRLDDVWVVANFKEDQVGGMKPGQRAEVSIDSFPGKHLVGKVDSLAGGTGSRFALLPPDNASGNFTKVVQRVPVLVRLELGPGAPPLRPGLSADVTVFTKD
jgi:membrane fusion protein (multidrug efflux system)